MFCPPMSSLQRFVNHINKGLSKCKNRHGFLSLRAISLSSHLQQSMRESHLTPRSTLFGCPLSLSSFTSSRFFHYKPTRKAKGLGLNTHMSNRAKKGLYHGKDVRSGNMRSKAMNKTKRKWYPNVHRKRLFSYTLDTWVRFQVTTTALREIDTVGGIDNYLMKLDDKSVARSNYVTKMHRIISISLFHQGKLSKRLINRFGFDISPPPPLNYGDPNVIIPSRYSTPYGDRTTSDRKLLPVGIQAVKYTEDSPILPSKPDLVPPATTLSESDQSASSSSSSSSSKSPSNNGSKDATTDSTSIKSADGKMELVISPFAPPDAPFIEDLDLMGEVIFLRNPSQLIEADISGWQVSDQKDKHKWTIPDGTVVPPDSSMHIYCNSKMIDTNNLHEHHIFWTNKDGTPRKASVLNNEGDTILLVDSDGNFMASCEKKA